MHAYILKDLPKAPGLVACIF